MYLARKKAITAPMHDPKKQAKMAAKIPWTVPMAAAKANPGPKIKSVGGMNITARSKKKSDKCRNKTSKVIRSSTHGC